MPKSIKPITIAIRKLKVKNFKALDDFEIEFPKPRMKNDEAAKSRISENMTQYKVEIHHQLPLYLVVQIIEKYFLPDRQNLSKTIIFQ